MPEDSLQKNRDVALAKKRTKSREYYYKNRDRVLARMRKRHPEVREQKNAYCREWYSEHKEEQCVKHRLRRRQASIDSVIHDRVKAAQKNATHKQLPFNITAEYIRQLYDAAPFCVISGLNFDFTQKYSTLSLDRIEPALGYVVGNVRLVRWQVNCALQNWGDAVFYQMVDAIAARKAKEQS